MHQLPILLFAFDQLISCCYISRRYKQVENVLQMVHSNLIYNEINMKFCGFSNSLYKCELITSAI